MNTLVKYLTAERGRQARLASTIGVSAGYLSDVANGKKAGSIALFRAISDATGLPLGDLMGSPDVPSFAESSVDHVFPGSGFADSDVAPFRAKSAEFGDILMTFARQLATDAKHLMPYIAQRDFLPFGILQHDLLIIGTPAQGKAGDLVIASLSDGQPHHAVTVLRQRMGNTLVPPVTGALPNEDTMTQGILGTVLTVIRSQDLTRHYPQTGP